MSDQRQAGMTARIGVAFTLECKDAEGNVLKTIPMRGALSLPIFETTEPEEQPDGLDRSQ